MDLMPLFKSAIEDFSDVELLASLCIKVQYAPRPEILTIIPR